jgi:hypothetical protein
MLDGGVVRRHDQTKSINGHLGLQECGVAAEIEQRKSATRKPSGHPFLPFFCWKPKMSPGERQLGATRGQGVDHGVVRCLVLRTRKWWIVVTVADSWRGRENESQCQMWH